MIHFEWDPAKDLINFNKHGVSFAEAATVFLDDFALIEYDCLHSLDEDRYRIIGRSTSYNILIVVHCIRDMDIKRIISARKATSSEIAAYERSIDL